MDLWRVVVAKWQILKAEIGLVPRPIHGDFFCGSSSFQISAYNFFQCFNAISRVSPTLVLPSV